MIDEQSTGNHLAQPCAVGQFVGNIGKSESGETDDQRCRQKKAYDDRQGKRGDIHVFR